MDADNEHTVKTRWGTVVEDPPVARFLFDDTRLAAIWLAVRVLIGLVWLESALGKLGNPGMGTEWRSAQGLLGAGRGCARRTGAPPPSPSTGTGPSSGACSTAAPTHGLPSWSRSANS
ncbi:MAG: hypothetical protein M5U14_19650 [Acidimicrobiia bacterium]|nr:hypothetical protein [Acidimicrobiia bacterium]